MEPFDLAVNIHALPRLGNEKTLLLTSLVILSARFLPIEKIL